MISSSPDLHSTRMGVYRAAQHAARLANALQDRNGFLDASLLFVRAAEARDLAELKELEVCVVDLAWSLQVAYGQVRHSSDERLN